MAESFDFTVKNTEPYKPVTEEYVESLADLESSSQFQGDSETYLEWLANNTTGWQKFADAGSWGGNEDIFEVLRDEDMRLGTIAARASQLKEAPNDVKQAYARIRTRFDNADTRYSDNFISAVQDIGVDLVADPINIVTGLFTSGVGLGTSQAAKQGVTQTLKRLAVSNDKKTQATVGAVTGSLYTGADNYYRQNTELAAGLRDTFSSAEVAGNAAIGGVVGGSLGYLFGATNPSKQREKTLDLATSSDNMRNFKEADVDEDTLRASTDFANAAKVKIESEVFIDLDESQWDSYFDDIVDDLASQVGGTETTKNSLRDAVRQTIKENQGASGIKVASELRYNTNRVLHGLIPKTIGKPAGIFNKYTEFSNTAKILQKKFRYDLGRKLRGDRELEAPDFFEEMNFIRGDRITRLKTSLEPILINAKGAAYDDLNDSIVTILRGGEVPNASEEMLKATSEIRVMLDEIGEDLLGYGIIDEPLTNYFPRMWDRRAILKDIDGFKAKLIDENNPNFFSRTVIKDGAKVQQDIQITASNVDDFIEELLDKKHQVDVGGTTRSFFSKRKLNLKDDNLFEEYLDNDINSVLISYISQTGKSTAKAKVFGVRNITEFKKLWLDPIVSEMKQSGKVLTEKQREEILNVYRTATGEGVSKFSDSVQEGLDWYVLGTRMALLPLATLSSITEIAINMSKAGVMNSAKGFAKASEEAFNYVGPSIISKLTGKGKLSRPEAFKELNSVMLAMDQAVADGAERLSGDALSNNLQRKINNGFFKLNMLDQWTKFVQLTSFTTAKELINDNLGKIASAASSPTKRTQFQADQLTELGLDVDEALNWFNAGASKEDDYYDKVLRAAARYTNEVILNPSPEAGIKPNIMSNPRTAILTQLLGYPAAFTNVILKRFITDSIRDPSGNVPKIGASAILMTEMARLSNYARSHGESERNKTPAEARLEAVARWGGNGLLLDMYERGKKSAQVNQSAGAFLTGFGGPVLGDVYKIIRQDRYAAVLSSKVPGYAAFKPVLGEDFKDEYDKKANEIDKKIRELIPERETKISFAKGGVVADVPNVPVEPDQRIDKITGLPYDQQAGTAFVDEEDPLRRLGFKGGGEVDPLARLGFGVGSLVAKTIRQYAPKYIKDSDIEEATDELEFQRALPSDDPEVAARVQANIEGRAFTDPEEIDYDIEEVLEGIGAKQSAKDAFIQTVAQQRSAGVRDLDVPETVVPPESDFEFSGPEGKAFYIQKIQEDIPNRAMDFKQTLETLEQDNSKEAQESIKMLNKLLIKMPRTLDPVLQEDDVATNLPERLQEFIKNSEVQEPVYRATGHGVVTDFEVNFALPSEIGPHFGTKGQADFLSLREYFDYGMDLERMMDSYGMTAEELYKTGVVVPGKVPAMTKGYLNIKNPLVLEGDFGDWSAFQILTSENLDQEFLKPIIKQSSKSKTQVMQAYSDILKPALAKYKEFIDTSDDDSTLYKLQDQIRLYDLNIKLKEFLKLQDFDGVKYLNTVEGDPEERISGAYSYIAFDPRQYKIVTASQFDPTDPRVFKAEGGKVLKALSRGRYSTGKEVRADMRRSDGSVKSAQGFLGPVENTVQGGTMTEVSIGTEINGKEMEIPTMVPTLTKDEVKTLSSMKLEGNARSIPESIIMKAKEHARMRLEQGKSPFYQDGE